MGASVILQRVIRERLLDKVIFEQRSERSHGVS